MKKLKSLSAVILCICLIASVFAGCSKKISLEGTWRATIDLTNTISKELTMANDDDGEYFGDFSEPISIDVIYTFDSENAYTVSVDEEKFKSDCDAYIQKYIDYFAEGTYKYAESQGMTREQFDENYKKENGKTLKESFAEEFKSDDIYTEIASGFSSDEKKYTQIEDDKFYITDENGNKTGYETFTLEDNTLTINGEFDMNDQPVEDEDNIYPLVLTKTA